MKKLLTTTLFLLITFSLWAENKTFDTSKKYRIACNMYGTGGIVTGANHGASALIYYDLTATAASNDIFWTLNDEGGGKYSIRNAQTNQYLTFDNVRVEGQRKYLNLTDGVAANDSSYWYFAESGSYCTIVSAAKDTVGINVRTDGTYLVGGYTYATSSNSLFQLYDENGNLWGEEDNGGGDDPEWTTEYTESMGLDMPVVLTTNLSNPVYYHIRNIRQNRYVTATTAGNLTETSDEQTLFYFVQGTDGVNIYTKNGLYISGEVPSDLNSKGVQAVTGTSTTDTWTFGFNDTYGGYGIQVKSCTKNNGGGGYPNWNVLLGNTYWNDYSGSRVGFYSMDSGSAFVFLSGDERHKAYLEEQGVLGTGPHGSFSNYLDTLTINGKPLVYDTKYRQYMAMTTAENMGGNNYTATIKYVSKDATDYTLAIDSTETTSGTAYTFAGVEGTKKYTLVLKKDGEAVATSPVTFTSLPIVEINGSFSTTYAQGTIRVNQLDTETDTLYNARLKHRGATASTLAKKAYAIKLSDAEGNSIDREFFGLREDNNWILDAMSIEPGRSRNRVSTDLWNDYSTPQYYKDKEPKALNGTRGRYVEVLLNGKYQGLYCMTEKLDRKQLKLKKYEEETDNIRGTLYKSTQWSYEVFMGYNENDDSYPRTAPSAFNNNSDIWASYECHYPDLGDGQPIDWAPLWDAINVVAAGNDATFKDSVEIYFDMPVFRDYYLLIELMLATDNHGKNMYLYNYNKNKYKMLSVAPWDMDGTWGRRWDGSSYYTSDATQEFDQFITSYEHGQYTLYKRLKELDYKNFNDSLAYRYAELRKTYFDEESLINRFATYMNEAIDCGAETREYNRWAATDSRIDDLADELAYTSNWIRQRLTYLDAKYDIENIVPNGINDVNSNQFFAAWDNNGTLTVESAQPVLVRVYSLSGQLVRRQNVSSGITNLGTLPSGIYLVNGKKVLVK